MGKPSKSSIAPRGTRGRPPLKDERLKKIVAVAARLFCKNGYSNTSTREIAREAKISKSLLFYYIKSKEDVLNLFIQMSIESHSYHNDVLRQLPQTRSAEALKRTLRELITSLDILHDQIQFWYHESGYLAPKIIRKMSQQEFHSIELLEIILNTGCENGEFHIQDTHLTAYQIYMLCITWVLKRWNLRQTYTLEEYIIFTQNSALNIAGYKSS